MKTKTATKTKARNLTVNEYGLYRVNGLPERAFIFDPQTSSMLLIVYRDVRGYTETDSTGSQEFANNCNAALGVTVNEAEALLTQSLFGDVPAVQMALAGTLHPTGGKKKKSKKKAK